ncbi:MAG: TSUP family transporter, partial [Methermicoccaceae archaeon]
ILIGYIIINLIFERYGIEGINQLITYVITVIILFLFILYMRGELFGTSSYQPKRAKHLSCGIAGLLAGLTTQLTSIGSGVFTLLLLRKFYGDTNLLVGTNMVFSIIIVMVAAMGFIGLGVFDKTLTFLLVISSVPGILLGAYLKRYITEQVIRWLVTVTLSVSMMIMLLRLF